MKDKDVTGQGLPGLGELVLLLLKLHHTTLEKNICKGQKGLQSSPCPTLLSTEEEAEAWRPAHDSWLILMQLQLPALLTSTPRSFRGVTAVKETHPGLLPFAARTTKASPSLSRWPKL